MTDARNDEHDLEDHIPMLRRLNEVRQKSAKLRDEGINLLLECVPLPEEEAVLPEFGDWQSEMSLIVRALLTLHNQPLKNDEKRCELIKGLIRRLKKNLTLNTLAESELSVLVAAGTLRTLVAFPGAVFSKEAMLCYYWIVRELYTADRNDWNIGGARAAPTSSGVVTAFATGECVRALLRFAEALRHSGEFVEEVSHYFQRKDHLDSLISCFFSEINDNPLQKWVDAEKERMCLSSSLKLQRFSRYFALNEDVQKFKELNNKQIDDFQNKLKSCIEGAATAFETALTAIQDYRNKTIPQGENAQRIREVFEECLKKDGKKLSDLPFSERQELNHITRSESAHSIAVLAVKRSLEHIQKVQKLLNEGNGEQSEKIKQLKQEFYKAAEGIHQLLKPVRNYLSSILDREQALVSLCESWDWRPAELACAASCYGRLTNEWKKDLRLDQAVSDLSKMISNRGRFANPSFFHERPDGASYILPNSVVLHAIAQLLRHTPDKEIGADLADKMMRFFEDTRAEHPADVWLFKAMDITQHLNCELKIFRDKHQVLFHTYFLDINGVIGKINDRHDLPLVINVAQADELAKALNKWVQDKEDFKALLDQLIGIYDRSDPEHKAKELKKVRSELDKSLGKNNEIFRLKRRSLEILFPQGIVARAADKPVSDKKGWAWEFSSPPLKTGLKATAAAVLALAEINEMLDAQINHIILEHFTVKQKNKGLDEDLPLDKLFYPDYGLRLAPDKNTIGTADNWQSKFEEITALEKKWGEKTNKDWPAEGIQRKEKESVAITLLAMYAHISRLSLPSKHEEVFSLVLHGPAGTGKTTFVESLAVTCGVPLVEVTPSDLVKRGQENVEARARAVFEALSMLTRAVILFDEFDPVLKRRDPENKNQLNVFSFLTPGMLPKLKDLHSGAKKRSVAYVLITNLIGDLDEAAVREGRFDKRLGIYPPDLLSRTGRLLDQFCLSTTCGQIDDEKKKRIKEVIRRTGGKGMTTLGKAGWFRKPKDNDRKTPFNYIEEGDGGNFKDPPSDDGLGSIRGNGRTAVIEFLQWLLINKWDETIKDTSTFEDLGNTLGKMPCPQSWSAVLKKFFH